MLSLSRWWKTGSSPWQPCWAGFWPGSINLCFPSHVLASKPWLKAHYGFFFNAGKTDRRGHRKRYKRGDSMWRCKKAIITTSLTVVQRPNLTFHSCLRGVTACGASSHYSKIFSVGVWILSKDLMKVILKKASWKSKLSPYNMNK